MQENQDTVISTLIRISKIDAALAGILAERKKLESNLVEQRDALDKLQRESAKRNSRLADSKQKYAKAEKLLREEQQKLVDRRKALTSLQNYKLQSAAEKEIDHVSRGLSVREGTLVDSLDEMEKLEEAVAEISEQISKLEESLKKDEEDAEATFGTLEEREAEYLSQREDSISEVDESALQLYDRVRQRFPMDAVVPVTNQTCTGCFMKIVPQTMVEISRGEKLVRCRGCSRILYMGDTDSEQAKK